MLSHPPTSLAVGFRFNCRKWARTELKSSSFVVNSSLHSCRRLDLGVLLHNHAPGPGQQAEQDVVSGPIVVVGGGISARAIGLQESEHVEVQHCHRRLQRLCFIHQSLKYGSIMSVVI